MSLKFYLGIFCCCLTIAGSSIPCALRDYGDDKKVCVCNATYCDTFSGEPTINDGEFVAFISSKLGDRFERTTGTVTNTSETSKQDNILWFLDSTNSVTFTINTTSQYQTITGFGGAFTDAAGINILSLGTEIQEHLLRSYFSPDGIEYNLCRLPISGTDFSTHPYAYDDGNPDPELKNFSLATEDFEYKIPLIQRAINMSEKEIRLVSASWSPPAWMKTNNNLTGVGYLKEEYYDTYAKYILKFLEKYKKQGIDVWAVTTGNEPMNTPFAKFNSLGWLPHLLANWTANFFGPQLRNSAFKDTVLLAYEDQRLFLPWWIDSFVKADEKVLEYVNGFAIHWYLDFLIGSSVLTSLHENYPEKFLLYTEACNGYLPTDEKVDLGSWDRGEKYLASIIENLNNWVTGWLDWNLALDLTGGPNWVDNRVDSPILVNATADELYKQPMFYAMGHVSKFIMLNASRVYISPTEASGVSATAVVNPDGRVVVILLNTNDEKSEVSINITDKGYINMDLPARSYATVLLDTKQ